jgi:hypothetical protein
MSKATFIVILFVMQLISYAKTESIAYSADYCYAADSTRAVFCDCHEENLCYRAYKDSSVYCYSMPKNHSLVMKLFLQKERHELGMFYMDSACYWSGRIDETAVLDLPQNFMAKEECMFLQKLNATQLCGSHNPCSETLFSLSNQFPNCLVVSKKYVSLQDTKIYLESLTDSLVAVQWKIQSDCLAFQDTSSTYNIRITGECPDSVVAKHKKEAEK